MRKKNSLSKNYFLQIANTLLVNVIPIFTIPYLTRILGADNLGYYSYLASIASYFVLFANLGSASYGTREIAYSQASKEAYSEKFCSIQLLRTIIGSGVLFVYAIFCFFLKADKVVLLILSLNILNVIVDISWFYSGLEDFTTVVRRSVIIKTLYVLSLFSIVKSPDDFHSYVLIEVGFVILISISLWKGIRKKVIFSFKNKRPFKHFSHFIAFFVPALAIQLYTVVDKTMIGIFAVDNYNENAYYEFAQNIVRSCLFICTSLSTVSSPRISFSIASEDYDQMRKQLYISYRFAWFTALPICVVLWFIAPVFVPAYFGPGYERISDLIRVLCPIIIAIALSTTSGNQFLVPMNYVKFQSISLICGSIINICLNLIFIPKYAAIGASIASVISELAVSITQLIFIHHSGQLRISRIISSSAKYILACLGMVVVYFFITPYFNTGIISAVVLAAIGLAVYIISLLFLKDEWIFDCLQSIVLRKI